MKPRLLDLFCCEGGASEGYRRAGFDVYGVDIQDQPRYPFAFARRDALALSVADLRRFDAIHASPPCQAYSATRRISGRTDHPDLLERRASCSKRPDVRG